MVPIALVAFSFGLANISDAQQPEPDFRTDGYAAPVHIPPRVPLYDPGLPQSLNGKFNSTQTIHSDGSPKLRTVISDLTAPSQQAANSSFRTRTRTPQYDGGPRETQTSNRQAPKRKQGLQDRIAGMMAYTPPAMKPRPRMDQANNRQQPTPAIQRRYQIQNGFANLAASANRLMGHSSRGIEQLSQRSSTNRYGQNPQKQALQKTVNADPNRMTLKQRRGMLSGQQPQQRSPRQYATNNRQSPSGQKAIVAKTASSQKASQRPPRQMNYPVAQNNRLPRKVAKQDPEVQTRIADRPTRLTPPMVRVPGGGSRGKNSIRQVGLKQAGSQGNSFVTRAQGEFTAPTTNAASRNASIQFRRGLSQNTKAKPVSVLSRSADVDISLDPAGAAPYEVAPEVSGEVGRSSNSMNSLRSYQNETAFQEEDDEVSLDSDLGNDEYDTEDDDSENPLRKSCEEFRQQLLNDPITDIALDISPPGNIDLFGENVYRVWRDQYGNELAQGTIADLRRGYVIINTNSGGQVKLPYARLSDPDWLAISDYWRLPIECGLGAGKRLERNWMPQTVTWYASSLCHKPLYFENRQLERYGHTHGPFLQPAASTIHFFGKLFFLPYNTAINPPNECQYALGFYRPGNCAPWLKDPFPFSFAGAARQTTFWTGIGYLAD